MPNTKLCDMLCEKFSQNARASNLRKKVKKNKQNWLFRKRIKLENADD